MALLREVIPVVGESTLEEAGKKLAEALVGREEAVMGVPPNVAALIAQKVRWRGSMGVVVLGAAEVLSLPLSWCFCLSPLGSALGALVFGRELP